MKMKARLFIVAIIATILCGCGSTASYSSSPHRFVMGRATFITNYRVFQTISPHFALAIDNRVVTNRLVIAIRTSEESDPFYDGQTIAGSYVMVDTYTYETNPDEYGRTRVPTVPLVVPRNEYNKQQ